VARPGGGAEPAAADVEGPGGGVATGLGRPQGPVLLGAPGGQLRHLRLGVGRGAAVGAEDLLLLCRQVLRLLERRPRPPHVAGGGLHRRPRLGLLGPGGVDVPEGGVPGPLQRRNRRPGGLGLGFGRAEATEPRFLPADGGEPIVLGETRRPPRGVEPRGGLVAALVRLGARHLAGGGPGRVRGSLLFAPLENRRQALALSGDLPLALGRSGGAAGAGLSRRALFRPTHVRLRHRLRQVRFRPFLLLGPPSFVLCVALGRLGGGRSPERQLTRPPRCLLALGDARPGVAEPPPRRIGCSRRFRHAPLEVLGFLLERLDVRSEGRRRLVGDAGDAIPKDVPLGDGLPTLGLKGGDGFLKGGSLGLGGVAVGAEAGDEDGDARGGGAGVTLGAGSLEPALGLDGAGLIGVAASGGVLDEGESGTGAALDVSDGIIR